MYLTFLAASVPLTKAYSAGPQGVIAKTSYPFCWEFTSTVERCHTLAEFEQLLKLHSVKGHCLLKGTIARQLVNESRAGSTDANAQTDWVVLDLDGLPETLHGQTLTPDMFLEKIGLYDVSHVLQWSASYGIENKKLRAHVFFMLDRPYAAPLIKQWLIQVNHDFALLSESMHLTRTQNTLSWPLDITACQNDKLIYIAPPKLQRIKDPMAGMQRISLVTRKHGKLALAGTINSVEKNKALTHARISELRKAAGLPPKKITYKMIGSTEVMLKPDEAVITEMKQDRGFVYFNLNSGDSWAYFHPENNPDYILNFKGEPAYLTRELLPDYWAQLTGAAMHISSAGTTYLAFLDKRTNLYHRGTYDAATDELELYSTKNEKILRDACKQHGVRLGDFVPEWTVTFDPDDNVRVDPASKTINKFSPTRYMKAQANPNAKMPRTVYRVIHNALGSDDDTTAHFINWLAFIIQFRDRTKTAWVLHGVPGTGKGIMMNNILRPLFGMNQTAARRMDEFNEKFNHFLTESFIVFVDEVQTKALQNERGVMANLKNYITEEYITVREMRVNGYEVRNRTNWIFASNMPDPVAIDKDDRRFNVGKYQPGKLVISDAEIEVIPRELQAFHDHLLYYPCDIDRARTVMQNTDRDTLISLSQSSIDTVVSALTAGDFEFFLAQLPTDQNYERNALTRNRVEDYRDALKTILARTNDATGVCNIAREELRAMFEYVVGNMPGSPNKFTTLLKNSRMHLCVVWIPPKAVNGSRVVWKDFASFPQYTLDHFPTAPAKTLKLVTPAPTPKPQPRNDDGKTHTPG